MNAVTQALGPCPCGACDLIGTKIASKTGHLVGCECAICQSRANYRKGHRAQQQMHTALGGRGPAPRDEASARPYIVEVAVMPESKEGDQVPASFLHFLASAWFHHALRQAIRAVPVGTAVLPAVAIDGRWLIVDTRPPRGRRS